MKYYIDAFWPKEPEASGRDFGLWYHNDKKSRALNLQIGDKVILYETGKHPNNPSWKGTKKVFGSVTVAGDIIELPKETVSIVGGKLWNFFIPIEINAIVKRDSGIPWETVRELLGWRKGAALRSGPVEIKEISFIQLENELRGIYDERDYFFENNSEEYSSNKEGQKVIRTHWAYERDPKIVDEAKKYFLREHGKLFCSICGFSFEKRYGLLGKNIIDIHHIIPVSEYGKKKETKISDLLILCSNCHRIIHSKRPPFNVRDVEKAIIEKETN